jgi:hypothetical protein
MTLEGQYPSLSFLQIEWVLDRLIGLDDIVTIRAWIGIDQSALLALYDGVVASISTVSTTKRPPVAAFPLLDRRRVTHDGVVGSTKVTAYMLHQHAPSD